VSVIVLGAWIASIILAIGGKVEVVISSDSYVFTGIGKIGIKKKFIWSSVKKIYKRTWEKTTRDRRSGRASTTHYKEIIIQTSTDKIGVGRVLDGLYNDRFEFLLTVLRYHHDQKKG